VGRSGLRTTHSRQHADHPDQERPALSEEAGVCESQDPASIEDRSTFHGGTTGNRVVRAIGCWPAGSPSITRAATAKSSTARWYTSSFSNPKRPSSYSLIRCNRRGTLSVASSTSTWTSTSTVRTRALLLVTNAERLRERARERENLASRGARRPLSLTLSPQTGARGPEKWPAVSRSNHS